MNSMIELLQTPPTEPEIAAALEACLGVPEVQMIVRRLAFQRDKLLADCNTLSSAMAMQYVNAGELLNLVEESKPAIPHNAICFFEDGNKWCAVFGDFVNLQESPAGFGDNHEEALWALQAEHERLKRT